VDVKEVELMTQIELTRLKRFCVARGGILLWKDTRRSPDQHRARDREDSFSCALPGIYADARGNDQRRPTGSGHRQQIQMQGVSIRIGGVVVGPVGASGFDESKDVEISKRPLPRRVVAQ